MSLILNGRFKLLKAAAQGGTAHVYLAEEVQSGRKVAVKVMKKSLPNLADMAKRFEREARVMATLKHPNIVKLVHFEQASEGLLLLTDWVDGDRLDLLMGSRTLAPARAMSLLRQLASALAAIHARGVIHRDIKPENIIVTQEGVLKLLDFGIARFTEPTADQFTTAVGQIAGTPAYISPEQALGKKSDARTDVYTFGVLAYRMLSGQLPVQGQNDLETMMAHVKRKPEPLAVPGVEPRILDAVMRCLEKKPEQRPKDGQALVELLA